MGHYEFKYSTLQSDVETISQGNDTHMEEDTYSKNNYKGRFRHISVLRNPSSNLLKQSEIEGPSLVGRIKF